MKPKLVIQIAVFLLVFMAGIAVYFYQRGKKQITIQAPPIDDPNSQASGNNPSGIGTASILKLVEELYQEMAGPSMDTDVRPFNDYMQLSHTDFVNVYNVFNSKYQKQSGQTLKQWIEGEYAMWGSDFRVVKNSVLQRMASLNLR